MTGKVETLPGLTAGAISLKDELAAGGMPVLHTLELGDATAEVRQGRDTLWLVVRRGGGDKRGDHGGFALRTAHAPGMPLRAVEVTKAADGHSPAFRVETALGEFHVRLEAPDPGQVPLLRCTVALTPAENLLLPFLPRDLYPIDADGDPAATEGGVHAGQRGLNGGLLYLSLKKPRFGSLLYFQDLTSLNDFFLATGTKPDGVVGGQWPELGYQPPTAPGAPSPPEKPLPAGRKVILSDALLHWSDQIPEDPRAASRLFLDLLAGIYPHLSRPQTRYHDWPRLAEATLRHLDRSPKATIAHYGHRYVHPYTDFEYPDSMVQMTVLTPMHEYAGWKRGGSGGSGEPGRSGAFSDELLAGMPKFYDRKLETLRRYLPNVGSDKNPDEVDSWYLYHPLANLGRLAKDGDITARTLFLDSLEFGIRSARHFKYRWPVQYNVETLEIIKDRRKEGEPGQSDVGGLYAYVMTQAWDLTGDARYLEEAHAALDAIKDLGFSMAYQMNLTAWGVNACVRLWRITQEPFYRDQSLVFLANYLHNCVLWESRLGHAKDYTTFFGATCLHDGPYMAIYECFESFAAFEEYLSLGQDDLPDSVRLLLSEYYKHTLTRAWYFYPENLPKGALSPEVRNNEIDPELAFPLEDLYADGQPAGQVGQELYGCGAAFTFLSRAYHRIDGGAPFLLYCEYPLSELEVTEAGRVTLEVRGAQGFTCKARAIPLGRSRSLPTIHLFAEDQTERPNRPIRGKLTEEGHCEFVVPANQRLKLQWEQEK